MSTAKQQAERKCLTCAKPPRSEHSDYCADCFKKSINGRTSTQRPKWSKPCEVAGCTGFTAAGWNKMCPTHLKAQNDAKPKALKKPKRNMVAEEDDQPGACLGGCGKTVPSKYCPECRITKDLEDYGLNHGERELWRGSAGKVEENFIQQVVVRSAASVVIEPMTWLWSERIPEGFITWIVGQPGNAKSLMTIEIAACASTGKDWPDGSKNTLGAMKVLMFCGEDDLSRTVIPRLMAAGANLDNIDFLDSKSFRGTVGDTKIPGRSIDLDQDMEALYNAIKAAPEYKLLICDPITGIFGKKKLTKDEEVNPILEQLVDLCKEMKLTFIGVCHTPKRQTNSALEKIPGGSGVAGKCRAAFMLSRDPDSEDKHEHLMTIIKGNLTGELGGMKYKTVPCTVVDDKGTKYPIVKIEWSDERTDLMADDVLTKQNNKGAKKDRQAGKCEAFLKTFLAKGPVRSPEVYDAAKLQGFSDFTVRGALKDIGGGHVDRRTIDRSGYWMSLTPHAPFIGDEALPSKPEQKPERFMSHEEAL